MIWKSFYFTFGGYKSLSMRKCQQVLPQIVHKIKTKERMANVNNRVEHYFVNRKRRA